VNELGAKVSLIIPTLNEVGSIEAVLKEVPRDVVDEVLIVDGHSTDGTPELVARLGGTVVPQAGRGYGDAIATGFKHVTGDIIVLADADGSYELADIRLLVQRVREGADLALGSRYLPESGSDDDTVIRYVGNKAFTFLFRAMYHVEISDALFFYAAVRREVAQAITATSPGFEYILEFLIKAQRAGFKFAEIPSAEKARTAGKSKVNAFRDGLKMLWCMTRAKLRRDGGF
jgi:glycosyltransferase involved in cell wall biosynthesis